MTDERLNEIEAMGKVLQRWLGKIACGEEHSEAIDGLLNVAAALRQSRADNAELIAMCERLRGNVLVASLQPGSAYDKTIAAADALLARVRQQQEQTT